MTFNTMALNRYILNFKGNLPLPANDLELVRSRTNLLDTGRKTLLVEVQDEAVQELARILPDWTMQKEIVYPIPTTRPTAEKPPKP
jgi:hypothetical protein